MFLLRGRLRLAVVRSVRMLLSTFLVWWTAAYWYPIYGLLSAVLAGFVLAMFAEVPFEHPCDGRSLRGRRSQRG